MKRKEENRNHEGWRRSVTRMNMNPSKEEEEEEEEDTIGLLL